MRISDWSSDVCSSDLLPAACLEWPSCASVALPCAKTAFRRRRDLFTDKLLTEARGRFDDCTGQERAPILAAVCPKSRDLAPHSTSVPVPVRPQPVRGGAGVCPEQIGRAHV